MTRLFVVLSAIVAVANGFHAVASPRTSGVWPRATSTRACDVATAEATGSEAATAEEQMPAQGAFLRYYRAEKARLQYEKENPVNPLEAAMSRLDGPLKTLAVLAYADQSPETNNPSSGGKLPFFLPTDAGPGACAVAAQGGLLRDSGN